MTEKFIGREGVSLQYELHLNNAGLQPLYICLTEETKPEIGNISKAGSMFICAEGRKLSEKNVCKDIAELIHVLCKQFPTEIDDMRIILLGVDAAADGVWSLLALYPRLFAATVPVGGWGDPYAIRTVRTTPVLSFYKPELTPQTPAGGERGLADGKLMAMSLRGQGHENAHFFPYGDENPYENEEVQRWICRQDRRHQVEINCIRPGLWHIEDYFRASCYLVEGKDKALLIDTGMGEVDLPAIIARLTRLPVELAITHAHGDHYGNAAGFPVVYMHERDVETLPHQIERFAKRHPGAEMPSIRSESIHPVKEGDVIDLGGGIGFEVYDLPGHTIGSVVFISEQLGLGFTGDAFGSGEIVLLFGQPEELMEQVALYRESLRHFVERAAHTGDVVFFGGHRMQDASCDLVEQERIIAGGVTCFNPVSLKIAQDMEILCTDILEGRCKPVEDGNMRAFKSLRAGIIFRIEQKIS